MSDAHGRVREFLKSAPEQIGRYVVRREVGRGGMGVVYEADDVELGRRVALKVLREGETDPRVIARLHREASIAAQLRHPNVVGVHEVGMVRDSQGRATHFIAMDFVDGRTLGDLLAEGRTALPEYLRMIEEVARAVSAAHALGIIHRDLKPANVLVEKGGRVMLTDFGLAHAEFFQTQLTRSQAVMGTPQYMAPEQVRGRARDVDVRTDVYALGVMLYEVLTGRAPFTARTPAHLYQQILLEEPRPPSRGRTLDRDIEIVCLKAMEKEPARRYRSASAFADDLARGRRGEPISARPASLAYRVRKALKRRRAVIATAAAALVVGVTLWAGLGAWRASVRLRERLSAAVQHEQAGRLEDARHEYRLALEQRPDHAEARAGLARVETRIREAIDRQRQAVHDSEAQARVFKLIDMATSALDRAESRFYARSNPSVEVARCVDTALPSLEEAALVAPKLAHPHYHLGRAWDARGWTERAEKQWRTAIELDPKFAPAHYKLGQALLVRAFRATTVADDPCEVEPLRTDAEALAREAETCLREAAAGGTLLGDEVRQAFAAALLAYARRDADECARLVESALTRYGNREGVEEFHWLRGLTVRGAERRAAFDRALELRPWHPVALYLRAAEEQSHGDPAVALRYYDALIEVFPGDAIGWANRGTLHLRHERVAEAMRDLDEAIRLNPQDPIAVCNRGTGHSKLGEFEKAIEHYDRALALRPRYVTALNQRARTWRAMGKPDRAMEDFARSIEINPRSPLAYNERAIVLIEAHDFAGAERECERALEADRSHAATYVTLGNARMTAGRFDAAIEAFDQAVALAPSLPEAYYGRALARGADANPKKDMERARADLRKAIEVAPTWGGRALVQQLLDTLDRRRQP